MSEKKKILFSLGGSSYSNKLDREALDTILAFAAFEQNISIYFHGEALWQLFNRQQTQELEQKNLGETLQTFELCGIDKVFINEKDFNHYQLDQNSFWQLQDTSPHLEVLTSEQLTAFFHQHDICLDY